MKQKTERRLEDLERDTGESQPAVRIVIRDTDGSILNTDGTPYVEVPEPLPPGSRLIEIVIVDPPNRPPFAPPFDPTVKTQLGPAVDSQVRY